uniref:Cytochrome P450 n=1 Tax=Glossina palpalis gambiensis TaxID=67801 RepID=A0A1B0BA13_9MUSC
MHFKNRVQLGSNAFENKNNEFYLRGKKLLGIGLFDKKSTEYFMHLVLDAMKYRKENHIIRPDMINMLMEPRGMLKRDKLKSHNRDFETAVSLLCLIAHEVVENPDVQEKLLQEIQDVDRNLDGKPLTYDVIRKMPLQWTGFLKTGQKLEIRKSDAIWIPALGTHRDPQYYVNPKKFDLERFGKENKDNKRPFTYLPFGLGDRNCIGR